MDHDRPDLLEGYGGEDEMPLGGYATLLLTWTGAAALSLLAARIAGRKIPESVPTRDLFLIGIATHKITRIATKDWVTAPLRAPFTQYEKSLGSGEVAETSRGEGLRRAVGDLMTCPWCSGPWIAGALFTSYLFHPRATRYLASMFSAVALSDWLHELYGIVRKLPSRLAD